MPHPLVVSLIATLIFTLLLPITSSPSEVSQRPVPHTVRIDHRLVSTHPDLVLDSHHPAFDWQLSGEVDPVALTPHTNVTQLAYRIFVTRADGDIPHWDSRRVPSSQSTHVVYDGPPFTSDTTYTYALMYWSSTGAVSGWAKGQFRTGLFSPQDWQGQWIGSDVLSMSQLRRTFRLPSSAVRATIFYSGLGYSELWLDGKKVDPSRVLDPGWTQYYRRSLYVSFDLTTALTEGTHCLGVVLGDGWYSRQPQLLTDQNLYVPSNVTYGPPRLLLQLNVQLKDGTNFTLLSDTMWEGRSGPTVAAGVYQGSVRDMRVERLGWSTYDFIDPITRWLPADILPSPLSWGGQLTLQFMDPIRKGPDALHIRTKAGDNHKGFSATLGVDITQTVLHPVSETEWYVGNIFDLGQNMVGWCTLNVSHLRGSSVYIRYSEYKMQPTIGPVVVTPNVDIDTTNLRNIAVEDVFIVNGTGPGGAGWEVLEPEFTYRGFRYVSIYSNYRFYKAADVSCPVVHSEGSLVGNFTTSSAVINQIQHNILWSQIANTMSLMTDCPQRNERKGWLGDASGSADLSMYMFDFSNVYRNHVNLMSDEQYPSGGLAVTIPISCCPTPAGAPSGDPNWTTAFTWIPWMLYEHYGDTTTLSTHYDQIQALFSVVYNTWYPQHGLKEMIVEFGDWFAQPNGGTDNALVTSFGFLRDCWTLIQISTVLNKTERVGYYTTIYTALAKEFHTTWYNSTTGVSPHSHPTPHCSPPPGTFSPSPLLFHVSMSRATPTTLRLPMPWLSLSPTSSLPPFSPLSPISWSETSTVWGI